MNVDLTQRTNATVDKLVRLACANDEDIAGSGLSFLSTNSLRRATFHHVDHLVVIMFVQPRSLTGFADDHEERDAHVPVIHPHKLVGHSCKGEL
jgi:hypothetical protein